MNGATLIPAWVDGALAPVDKLEVHRRGLRHRAVSVFLRRGDRVLLQQRAMGKYHTPGLWANACCTHPHWGEAAPDCAARRLAEELGVRDTALVYRHQLEYRADVGNGMVDVFVGEAGSGLDLAPDPAEVMDTRWVCIGALAREVNREPARFTPWLRIYLSDHAAQIFGQAPAA